MNALYDLGIVDLAQAIATGAYSAEQATQVALERASRIGRKLNLIVELDPETALETARAIDVRRRAGQRLGPLAGVPFAHKDLIFRRGRRALCGSPLNQEFVPDVTSTALARLDEAGAVDLGTLHMAEFALSPTGLNAHYGPGQNPWNPDYCVGGSSSGSGGALAALVVSGSLGSDTGGSIRHPAAMCGITGLKPSNGLVSLFGTMPLAPSLDTVGPMARCARDVARLLSIIAGPDAKDALTCHAPVKDYEQYLDGTVRGLTIAVPYTYYRDSGDPAILKQVDESLAVFKAAGASLVETTAADMELINAMMQIVLTVESATIHLPRLCSDSEHYGPLVRSRMTPGLALPAVRYAEALMLRAQLTKAWLHKTMGAADLVHLPTLGVEIPTIHDARAQAQEECSEIVSEVTHCTRAINYLGLPAIAVPCGFSAKGLPLSFQLVGRPYTEEQLLRAADAYQRHTDFHTQRPQV